MKKPLLPLLVSVIAFTYSYTVFATYVPKEFSEIKEVRGANSEKSDLNQIPYPDDAKNFSTFRNNSIVNTAFESEKTPEEIMRFYKNIFSEEKWKIKMEGEQGEFYIAEYKKDKKYFTIKASDNMDSSIVSIQIKED